MSRASNLVKWALTLGREPQNFLGAPWIQTFLRSVPASKKRLWALRILSLSPHYFINQENIGLSETKDSEFLENISGAITRSREDIVDRLFKSELDASFTVMDYGCGPGYLAKAVAPFVTKVYGVDISGGALACARIINGADNIEYLNAIGELDKIPDGKIDAIDSFAVVQHLTDEVFEQVLAVCQKKLKPGGRLILHIQLPDKVWKAQGDWQNDTSIKGRLKYRYGLHCFGRSEQQYFDFVRRHGFNDIQIEPIADRFPGQEIELASQRLLTARKT
jgi:SAM-dependent methyltransferase